MTIDGKKLKEIAATLDDDAQVFICYYGAAKIIEATQFCVVSESNEADLPTDWEDKPAPEGSLVLLGR